MITIACKKNYIDWIKHANPFLNPQDNKISSFQRGTFHSQANPYLRILDLSFNRIESIPYDTFRFPNLERLLLDDNQIQKVVFWIVWELFLSFISIEVVWYITLYLPVYSNEIAWHKIFRGNDRPQIFIPGGQPDWNNSRWGFSKSTPSINTKSCLQQHENSELQCIWFHWNALTPFHW